MRSNIPWGNSNLQSFGSALVIMNLLIRAGGQQCGTHELVFFSSILSAGFWLTTLRMDDLRFYDLRFHDFTISRRQ